jgi:transcriptional regulator with XRE-family HTH domain
MDSEQVVLRAEGRTAVASGRLQEVREAARLSQTDFAGGVGVSASAVGAWEHGRALPRAATAERLALLLRQLEQAAA